MEIDIEAIKDAIVKETEALQKIDTSIKAAQADIQNLMALRIETVSRKKTMQSVISGSFTEKKPARKPTKGK